MWRFGVGNGGGLFVTEEQRGLQAGVGLNVNSRGQCSTTETTGSAGHQQDTLSPSLSLLLSPPSLHPSIPPPLPLSAYLGLNAGLLTCYLATLSASVEIDVTEIKRGKV